jgi:hypothetical protein
MAYDATDKPQDARKPKKGDDEILRQALEDYEAAYEFQRANIDEANEDLRFRRGRKEDQWDAAALEVRADRPCLVINTIPQFIRQVTGDMRQMRPAIKVNPVDSRGDIKTAQNIAGMVRYIENRSFAKHVYTTAGDSQVACGIGHWRVTTEYASSTTFNQELRISGIKDGVSVLWDPDAEMPTKEDAMFCHVPSDISRRKFKKKYPDANAEGFAFAMEHSGDSWYSGDSVRVSEYWVKKPIKRSLVLSPDGSIDDITDQTKDFGKEELQGAAEFYAAKGYRFEQRDSFKVCRYLITANDILEEMDWPGPDIPIIPCIGEEVFIGREVYRHGVVRYARDPQRMVNYYASADAETTALQPKAPYMATLKQVQNHMDQWETANTQNHSVLIYDADPQAPGAPQRVQPPVPSQAIQIGKQQALDDMKRVIGIYDPGLGQKSNETSGKAIIARQQEGDTGTFVYIDNFNMAIQRTGQILLGLIPHIYDTQRQMRIIGVDGKESVVDINKPVIENGEETIQNDVTVGAYDVTLDVGPSYSTKRQEAKEGMREFIQVFPEAAPILGDLYAKGQDWPNAEEIGERLEVMQPPAIKQMLEQKKQEENPDAEPSPEKVKEDAAMEEAKQAEAMLKAAGMEKIKLEVQEQQAKTEIAAQNARKAKADADKAEFDAQAAQENIGKVKADVANTHMENLRTIQMHDADMERGEEDHRITTAAEMSRMAREQEQHERSSSQSDEKHEATIQKMKAKPEKVDA